MTIRTFGDSHAKYPWIYINNIVTNNLGPKLCYSIGRDGIDISSVEEGDTVIFCFGEIDCRCHIYKYVSETVPYTEVIDRVVNSYIKSIIVAISKFKQIKTIIYNIVPMIEKEFMQEDPRFGWNPEYPHLGSNEERKSYAIYFNKKLKEKCKENNFIFFDIYDKYIDSKGFLNKELSDGTVHIKDPTYIIQFMINNIL